MLLHEDGWRPEDSLQQDSRACGTVDARCLVSLFEDLRKID